MRWRKARLRRALGRAGVVEGCRHVCRRQGCGHFEAAKDQAPRRCPKDNQKLWVKPVVRPIRFHDQRHTTASLLTQAGANPASVQRMLRHSDPKVTERYRHLSPGYMRAEVDRLHFGLTVEEAPGPALEATQATACGGVVDSVVDHGPSTTKGPHVAVEALVVASELGAGNRIRTGDPQLGKLMLYQLSYSRVGRQICLDTGGRVKEIGPCRARSHAPSTRRPTSRPGPSGAPRPGRR